MTATILFSRLVRNLRRLRFRRSYVFVPAGVYGVYLLFGWLALPEILQTQAEKYVLQRSGHHLTMDRPAIDPLRLSLRIDHARLTRPDGKPLVSFKSLLVDFSATSLFRRALVFDEVRLDGPNVAAEILPDGRFNWSALIDAFGSKEKASSELPRLLVRKLSLSQGRLFLADRRGGKPQTALVSPINLKLNDLSTLPRERGRYALTARTGFGARIAWDGSLTLKPVALSGSLRVDSAVLPKLAAYLPLPRQIGVVRGNASLAAHYDAGTTDGRFNLKLDGVTVRVKGLRVQGTREPAAALALDRIALSGGRFDLRRRRIAVKSVAFSGGRLDAARRADGKFDLLALFPAGKKTAQRRPASAAGGWHYRIDRLSLDGFGIDFRDRTLAPEARIGLQDIAVSVAGLSEDTTKPLPLHVAFRSRAGGSFVADGTVVPADKTADLQIEIQALALAPAQPYLGRVTTLKLADGTLSGEGRAAYDGKDGTFAGSAAVRNLRLLDGRSGRTFLSWKSLTTDTLTVDAKHVAMRELMLGGLDTRLVIAKDKSTNLAEIVRRQPSRAAAPTQNKTAPFPIRIGRLRVKDSQLDFADYSLALPFGTRIHDLTGTVVNITSKRKAAPARVQFEGRVDAYGRSRAKGRLDLFNPADFLDIKVAFDNIEMTRLTPYSATFAGRRITSGKLTLDLEYKIVNRRLIGDNRIIMDRLTLGDRVESPQARNLPLDLAIVILEDSNGRIDLGLPVSGSLDDPKFSYRRIIWKAVVNVVTKIVTAPFRALGAIFGGDDEVDGLVFEAGRGILTPPEREKAAAFAASMAKHPKLAAALHGTWSDIDRTALQDLQLRRAIARRLGLSAEGDPGLLTSEQPKVKAALEDLYVSRFGNGNLAALQEGFRKANPGQLETTASGRFLSVLTGLVGTKPTLSEKEVAAMKGRDFHELLYGKLQRAETVSDATLEKLAQSRGEAVMAELLAAHAPAERLTLREPEKVDADKNEIPVKIDMVPVAADK